MKEDRVKYRNILYYFRFDVPSCFIFDVPFLYFSYLYCNFHILVLKCIVLKIFVNQFH